MGGGCVGYGVQRVMEKRTRSENFLRTRGRISFRVFCLPRYDSNVNSLTHLHANLFAYSYANMPFTNENEKPESLSDISRKGGYATHT